MIHCPNPNQIPAAKPAITWVDGRAQVTIDGIDVLLIQRGFGGGNREWKKQSQVYGAIDALVPELDAEEPYRDIAIPNPATTPVDKLRAKVWRAWRNATTGEAVGRLRTLLDKLAEFDGINVPVEMPRFSQTAGCSCGCSPGFLLGRKVESVVVWSQAETTLGKPITVERPVDIWLSKAEATN